jgi:glycosyltransferase involved in cell wall biosynthesis
MDVSVVVCTYNRAPSLGLTLRALDVQVTPPDLTWELVVVDNNSADATRSVVDAFTATARIQVRYLFEPQQGLSHARNAGIAHARGGIVAFTDDDVRPEPDWVAGVNAALRETGADIVGGRILPAWDHPPPAWLEARPFLRGPLAIMEHPMLGPVVEAGRIPNVWGANMAFRREVFERAGLFDPRRGVTGRKLYRGEEVELLRRALAAGYRAVYDPRVVVWHRIAAGRMRRRYVSRLYFERAEGDVLAQAAPQGRLLLGVPPFVYRRTAHRLGGWLWAAARRCPDTFDRWLESCEAVGSVWGLWKRRFRARSR